MSENHNDTGADEGGFSYGWCYTDRKDGKEIRRWYRQTDYMKDEPYAGKVRNMLDRLGLPQPDDSEIFRGSHHDLLFLDSHGVVLRIGPTDVTDLINPGILQPLGWLEDPSLTINRGGKDVPFTIAIYPGIELYENYLKEEDRPELAGALRDILVETGQGTGDINRKGNTGVINITDEDGKTVVVEILLDPDDKYNSSDPQKIRSKKEKFAAALKKTADKSAALAITLSDAFRSAKNAKPFQKAFQMHQPLRNLFWRAFKDGDKPDEQARTEFWAECAAVTAAPKKLALSHWTSVIGEDGKLTVTRTELSVDNVKLKTPWTTKISQGLKSKLRNGALSFLHKSVNKAAKVKNRKPRR
ncbi:MAG: hypothetical protein EP349_08775 [Alphaproteobacteria bacterium]|nr:MAG: hypothetical protein EP349_08775 [Alphaproteobacteria bacterium]